jgi:hypothetical protein
MKSVFAAVTACVLLSFFSGAAVAQSEKVKKKKRKGEVYLSWGYNDEEYTHSNISVLQPALGNNYTFKNITARDHPGWNDGIFNKPLSVPQYNYRLGFIFDKKKDWGFEINFDHTKYIFSDQNAHVVGTLGGRHVDTTIAFNAANGFYYYLNNGANFLLFNLTKRLHVYATHNGNAKLDFFGKVGIGPVIPHVQNQLFGIQNSPHFQLGGWNIGTEAVLRATFYKAVYLEYSNKLDYARYSGLKVFDGSAKQAFGTYEGILSLGFDLPMGKRVY